MTLNGEAIRLVRRNLDMSQKDFCQRVNISPSLLSRIENGSRVLTFEVEQKIRKEFSLNDLTVGILMVARKAIKEGGSLNE